MKNNLALQFFAASAVALLVGCGGTPTAFIGFTPKFSGKVAGWNGGDKVLKIITSGSPVEVGTLKADGSFNVELYSPPAIEQIVYANSSTCKVVPDDLKVSIALVRVYADSNSIEPTNDLTQNPGETLSVIVGAKTTQPYRIFANKDATVTCNTNATYAGAWNLKNGWNEVIEEEEVLEVKNGAITNKRYILSMGNRAFPWRVTPVNQGGLFSSSIVQQ